MLTRNHFTLFLIIGPALPQFGMGVRGLFITSGWIVLEDTMAASGQERTFGDTTRKVCCWG
jgi:hypothetical protein